MPNHFKAGLNRYKSNCRCTLPGNKFTGKFYSPYLSIMVFCSLVLSGCAKIGSPTGGPKDEWPPRVVESMPVNKSTSVTAKDIEITFDEFIVLKNLNEELTISPPLKEKPVTRIRNKTLVVGLNNDLRDSITYTLNFGNAITDNNEGNPLPDYEFVFSTGPVIDSLSLTGRVVNAFTLAPEKEKITVMLYDQLSDSAPYNSLPLYIGKTSPEGKYIISNIRSGNYRLFALKDGNNNLKFDRQDEMIAFSDSVIVLNPGVVEKVSFVKDTSVHKPSMLMPAKGKKTRIDSVRSDTAKLVSRELYARNANLYLFTEEDLKQRLTDKERERREMVKLVFSRPLFDSIGIAPVNFSPADKWYLQDVSATDDTVKLWLTDPEIWQKDTLSLAVTYTTTDSAQNYVSRQDTVTLKYRVREARGGTGLRSRRKEAAADSSLLALSYNARKQAAMDLNAPLILYSPSPVSTFDLDKIKLERGADTVFIRQEIKPVADPGSLYTFAFNTGWAESTMYQLTLEPQAVTDIYGKTNDTLVISFRTQKMDFYGRILLTLNSPLYPVIIQLLNEKDYLIREETADAGGQIIMDYLQPGKYRIRAVFDTNRNNKWDTGNYLKHLQPEKVIYYPDPLELRSNWDMDINWTVQD